MKKLLTLITTLVLCVFLTACNTAEQNEKSRFEGMKFLRTSADGIKLSKTFDDVIELSDFIVVGEFIDDSEIVWEYQLHDDRFNKDVTVDVVSSCPMKITKVLYGDANEGDIVNVLQAEGVLGEVFMTRSMLTPMQKGDEWIFCLSRAKTHDLNGYWCVGESDGRYPSPNSDSNEIMCFSDYPDLGVYEESDFNSEFYDQLKAKFNI